MKHFVSVIFEKQLNESKRDIVLDTMINTARIGLVENEIEYELFESNNSTTVLRLPLAKAIATKDQQKFVETLANKLFDKGHNNFEIELTEATLRRGSRGPEVQALQQQLGVNADGIFGPETEQALRAFQQRAGIQVDGIAGGQTQAALAAGGSPRNAGQPRAATAPFTPGQGSATQAPPETPPTAAPQTSPRPQARPETPPTAAPQTSPRPQARPETPPAADTTVGNPLARNPVDRTRPIAAPRTNVQIPGATSATPQSTGPTTRGGPRGTAAAAPAAPQAQTAAPARPAAPAAQGALAARVPGTDFAQQGRDATRPTTAPQLGAPAAAGTPPAVNTTPPAAPVRAPQAQTTASSARPAGQPGRAGMAGDEMNALDAISADRDSGALPTPTSAAPRNAPADGPATIPGPGQAARPGSGAPQPADELTLGGVPAGGPGDDQAQRAAASTQVFPSAPPQGQDAADAAVDARMDADARAAPAAGAAQALSAAMRGFGTDEEGIAQALQGVRSQADWDAIKTAYDGDLLADLASELNTRDYQRYVSSVLQAAGVRESVPARPKGAFMFRERAEWDELFGTTYNKDGSPKARKPVFESRVVDEETYHGDDFFVEYGVMWYNEDEELDEAEYQGRKVKLGKPMRGDVKKFKVYVRNPKGNVVKVNFGDPDMKIKKSNPERRRSFRARHNCDNPGPRHKARYWSCRKW